jgi:hypothetical protein
MGQQRLWIMVAGPYRGGAKTEAEQKANLNRLNRAAVEVFRKGHTPIIGVNMALPMIESIGQEFYSEIMMPISLSLVERCDAILRVEGESRGADKEVALFKEQGKLVFRNLDEIPGQN